VRRPVVSLLSSSRSIYVLFPYPTLFRSLIWAIMAIGVYSTYRVLDIADLTVDGTLCTGGAVCIMCMLAGCNVWVSILAATGAGLLAGRSEERRVGEERGWGRWRAQRRNTRRRADAKERRRRASE